MQYPLPWDFAEEQNSSFKLASQTVQQPKAISCLVLSEVAEVRPESVKTVCRFSAKGFWNCYSDDMMNASITGWWQTIYSVCLVSGDGFGRAGLSRSEKCSRSVGIGFQVPSVQFWLVILVVLFPKRFRCV